ncbi:MAG: hypothetical protein JW999_00235 [Methanotrichaceae archaeon]|nr:hypothetical protein [Methanotrichaceae archaeon]
MVSLRSGFLVATALATNYQDAPSIGFHQDGMPRVLPVMLSSEEPSR